MKRFAYILAFAFLAFAFSINALGQTSAESPIDVQRLLKDKSKYIEKEVYVIGRYESKTSYWNNFNISYNDYVIEVFLKDEDIGAQRRFRKLGLRDGDEIVVKGTLAEDWWSSYPELRSCEIVNIDYSIGQEEDLTIDEPEPELSDPRAAFPGMGKKDGNAGTANITDGTANAHLKGRKVEGDLIKPSYDKQASGVVVVAIYVDVYGNVQKAVPGAEGTTVEDARLWNEAKNAAMKTHFSKVTNITSDTPQLQEGTITYIFKLK